MSNGERMTKVDTQPIDADEKKVIHELERNSNESIDTIAKKCGFSRQKVWRIIHKLENNKTIWGYHAVVDREKLLLKSYIMLIKKTNRPIRELLDTILSRDIEKRATELEINIYASIYLHGCYDWILVFAAQDIKQAKKFCEEFNRLYHNHVSETYLLEEIFPVKYSGIENPNLKKLKDII